ncbi:MAG TPA: dockerin type I domain-containing protein, partial [Pirellulaceae bacterium]|nr:dockerin type I domain-containing protein [Pirellulaceae bacterium]
IATQFSGTVPNQLQITPPPGPVGYSFTVSVTVSDGIGQDTESFQVTVQSGPPDPGSDYDIDVNFIDNSLSSSQQAIFSQAAARWEQIITGDVPDVIVSGIGLVDDVVIEASGPFIDGPGNILGQAGPTAVRTGSFLPASGIMQFDSADLAALESAGQLFDVILHEMAHVLGLGTIWNALGLLVNPAPTGGGGDPRFVGASATAEYQTIFGVAESSVPAANTGGGGTLNSHWRESTFNNELMTGFLNFGVNNPISRVTVGQFGDLGYVVNLNAADAYTRPIRAQNRADAELVAGRLVVLDLPYEIIPMDDDPAGTTASASNPVGTEVASVESSWQNQIDHNDVNNDDVVSAMDALLVVNDLNLNGPRALGARPDSAHLLDVNGDLFVSTIDVLQIINRLNGDIIVSAEGETSTPFFGAETDGIGHQRAESDADSPSEPIRVVSPATMVDQWWDAHEDDIYSDNPEDDSQLADLELLIDELARDIASSICSK